jgi:hypothetical protein
VIQPGDVDVLLAPIRRDHRSGYSRVALIAIAPWMPTRIVTAGTSRRDNRVLNLVFWDRMRRFRARYCITGCGTILARKKQYSEKHTSIHEDENKILHGSDCRSGSDCVFYQEGDLVQAKVALSNIPKWLL